jgi:diguanylate cyclase (GGDEF)-like protein
MPDSRLTYYRDVLQLLPDESPEVAAPSDVRDDVDALGQSIAELTTRLALRQNQDTMLASVSDLVMQGVYLDEVLNHVYDGFRTLIPYDRIGCALLEDGGSVVRARWARSESPERHLNGGFAAVMAGSSLQAIVESGKPRIINDLEAYAASRPPSRATRLILAEGVRSSLTCLLVAMGRPIGFLFFSSKERNRYEAAHAEIFLRLAGMIAGVIEKGALYEQLAAANNALREARDSFEQQATHDALTGLWNRRATLQFLERVLAQSRRHARAGAVLMMDIDHFKAINDSFGHPAGDGVLREVARRVTQVLRAGDVVGRHGGEEFLLVLDGCSADGAARCAERLLAEMRSSPVVHESHVIPMTVSVGVVHESELGRRSADALIAAADGALYRAKREGRDQWRAAV